MALNPPGLLRSDFSVSFGQRDITPELVYVSVLSHFARHLRISYGDDRLVGRHIAVSHTCHQGGFTAGLDHQKRLRKAWSRIGPAVQPDSEYLNRNYRNIVKGPFILLVQVNEF
jgi:hypothetical protein